MLFAFGRLLGNLYRFAPCVAVIGEFDIDADLLVNRHTTLGCGLLDERDEGVIAERFEHFRDLGTHHGALVRSALFASAALRESFGPAAPCESHTEYLLGISTLES